MAHLIEREKTYRILSCAYEVHSELGPGLLESAYRHCLMHQLKSAQMTPRSEVPIPLHFRGVEIDCGYRADIIVDDQVLLELKTVESLLPIHKAQIMTYLKLTGLRVGLLLNFNSIHLRYGFRRIVI